MKMSPKDLGPRVVGGKYHSGYWDRDYQVLAINDDGTITVDWVGGKISTHRTAWDPKNDRVIDGSKTECRRCRRLDVCTNALCHTHCYGLSVAKKMGLAGY